MSLLQLGAQCAVCSLVDFLPTTCPHCTFTFCRDHIASHHCPSSETSTSYSKAGPSSFDRKAACELQGCKRPSIEAMGGFTGEESGERIARQVRCAGCSGSFCTVHRRQDDHSCPAPRDHTTRSDAADARKVKAADILAKHFPHHPAKEIAKPTAHTRDLKRQRPTSPPRLSPGVPTQPIDSSSSEFPPPGADKVDSSAGTGKAVSQDIGSGKVASVKSKEVKLFELQIRKLRMGAKPLDPKQKPDKDRRFFELKSGVTDLGAVETWRENGTTLAGTEKVWIHQVTPIGRILDMMMEKNKIKRPLEDDAASALSLIALTGLPGQPRGAITLHLSNACSSLPEGSTVILVKGRIE